MFISLLSLMLQAKATKLMSSATHAYTSFADWSLSDTSSIRILAHVCHTPVASGRYIYASPVVSGSLYFFENHMSALAQNTTTFRNSSWRSAISWSISPLFSPQLYTMYCKNENKISVSMERGKIVGLKISRHFVSNVTIPARRKGELYATCHNKSGRKRTYSNVKRSQMRERDGEDAKVLR